MAAAFSDILSALSPEQPVLVAGPTASGKSALAMEIAERQGGVIVNADASQVYDCWRVITARPSVEEEEALPHVMYGHIAATAPYSTGHWLREVAEVLKGDQRPIITGGTGLYFRALTHGLTEMPSTPPDVRTEADGMSLHALIQTLDPRTKAEIDLNNRVRVQRAWEVLTATGRGLADWQAETGTPLLPQESCYRVVFNVERDWLNARIARRFDLMLEQGALAEVEAVWPDYNPKLPAHRAIGVTELMGYVAGELTLDQAREATVIATRQYAKRQRTWARSKMADWHQFDPQTP